MMFQTAPDGAGLGKMFQCEGAGCGANLGIQTEAAGAGLNQSLDFRQWAYAEGRARLRKDETRVQAGCAGSHGKGRAVLGNPSAGAEIVRVDQSPINAAPVEFRAEFGGTEPRVLLSQSVAGEHIAIEELK
jgi:hypothetical protein